MILAALWFAFFGTTPVIVPPVLGLAITLVFVVRLAGRIAHQYALYASANPRAKDREGWRRRYRETHPLCYVAAFFVPLGTSLSMPKAGSYRLIYSIRPPSAGGLGRHHDPVTGVAPWWGPFEVAFDWDYEGPVGSASAVEGNPAGGGGRP